MVPELQLISMASQTASSSSSSYGNFHMEENMDRELYKAAKEGKDDFLQVKKDNNDKYFVSRAPQKNNIIHIAARAGHESFIQKALDRFPILANQTNAKGDTPLHVAAGFGHVNVVKILTDFQKCLSSQTIDGKVVVADKDVIPPLWMLTNSEGSTPLHEALRKGHEEVSLHLLDLDFELASSVNKAGESPLYLAVESNCEKFLEKILGSSAYSVNGPHGQTPLHVAKYCSEQSFQLLLEKRPELARQADEHGKTVLHYAVEENLWWMPILLKQVDPSPAYHADNDGYTPLLKAALMGSSKICQSIIECCPQSIEARDKNGQNALHLFKMQWCLHGQTFLNIPEIRELINEPDNEGNTPFHLAIKHHDSMKAKLLLSTNMVDLRAMNNEGFTALDICESDWKHSFRQQKMWLRLKYKKAPHGRHPKQQTVPIKRRIKPSVKPDSDWKQIANTLSVVAALLATVTFTAAFTMPGGYNNNDNNLGGATLIKKAALQVFVLADTFAMCCSITVVFFLIWAMIGEPELLRALTNISQWLLKLALYGTLGAFVTGLYAVIAPEALWVAVLVCLMCSVVPFVVSRKLIGRWASEYWSITSRPSVRGSHMNGRKRNRNQKKPIQTSQISCSSAG